ncbi:MAG: hypothetical protein WA364_18215 [Candidatus Nitrosopolaris sp.]
MKIEVVPNLSIFKRILEHKFFDQKESFDTWLSRSGNSAQIKTIPTTIPMMTILDMIFDFKYRDALPTTTQTSE